MLTAPGRAKTRSESCIARDLSLHTYNFGVPGCICSAATPHPDRASMGKSGSPQAEDSASANHAGRRAPIMSGSMAIVLHLHKELLARLGGVPE